jgi:predicted MFS family arabinose efflux permease/quinol monooxygenase YgiN
MTFDEPNRTSAPSPSTPAPMDAGALTPFHHRAFAVLWIATVISNVGTWMQSAGAGWLMTTLDPDPFTVSLVQVATSLPMFIFAIPAGALADIVDRRRLLIVAQLAVVVVVAGFALLVERNRVTPNILLTFGFLSATTAALILPAWQSIVPLLVPRRHLQPAIALNGVGLNVSRAIGPALSGVIIAGWGLAAPFWVNAFATLFVIAGLVWWHPPKDENSSDLPSEQFSHAIRAGFRHVRYNPHLRATLIRAAGFFVFASAYWALLPLLARNQVAGGPTLYGVLLGAIGAGAVAGAFALPWLNRRLGTDLLVIAGTAGTAFALLLFALARQPAAALGASAIAGASWITVLATINVSAQVALPSWVRGRGLSMYMTVMFGSLTLGSAIWGKVAALTGLPTAHLAAAAGALITIPLLQRWKPQSAAGVDLTPSMHWPQPDLLVAVDSERGPVLVTVDYRIRPDDRAAFLRAIASLAGERRRDGAFEWDVFEDASQPGRFVEIFMLDSWLEHLRQHQRVTHADRELQETVNRFNVDGAPKVTHFISASSDKLTAR